MNRKPWLSKAILLCLLLSIATPAIAAMDASLLEMSEQMDGIDKQDFQAAIDKANACIRERNFPCAETELAKAAKMANSGQDKKTLLASRNNLTNERQQLALEIRRAEEERLAQIRRDEEEKYAQRKRDEEREAREWREKWEAQEAEDRQSTRDYNASIGAQIMQNINNNAASLARIDRQTNAAINEANRVRAAQAAERDRARAEKEEREADRRRDAERDRAARADAQRTADARRVQEDARIRQQEQERLQKQARLEEQAQLEKQARQQEQERKQEQARKKAEEEKSKLASGSGGSSGGPSAEKIYVCPSREYFTSLMHYRAKNLETFTFEEACARAEQKAAEFVAGVGKYKFGLKDFADKRVVKNVDACRKTKSGDQVVVYVNLEGPELRPCGTASTGVSR